MISSKFAWNDFFSGTPATTLKSTQYSSRQNPSGASVYVSNCLFNKCTITSGNGGALCCTSATYFLVESSSFISCKTNSGYGGAIYSASSNTLKSVLYAVCGYDCCAVGYGPFVRIEIQNAATNNNCVNYTSVTRCVNDESGSVCMLTIYYGKIYCPSVNVSMNKCRRQSAIIYSPFVDSNSFTSLLSYSTFADNIATHTGCVWCNSGNAKYEIKCCNVLRNKDLSGSEGIIFARGNLMIYDSCILENNAPLIFYQQYTECTTTLSNCTVDIATKTGNVVTQNTVLKSFILGLNHMSTQNCHAQYDSAGYLTAVPNISSPTTKKFYYSCKNHYQAQISDFFIFHFVFLFTFIHSNPSENFVFDCDSFCV
jgi:hypothetical protein